jgi:putative endonuclease
MNYRQKVGKLGEDLAVKYLSDRGFRIIDRNVRMGHKEIDIVAKENGRYVFVEVKSRMTMKLGPADEALFSHKIKLFKSAVSSYLAVKNIKDTFFRLDFISVDLNKSDNSANIKHFKDLGG